MQRDTIGPWETLANSIEDLIRLVLEEQDSNAFSSNASSFLSRSSSEEILSDLNYLIDGLLMDLEEPQESLIINVIQIRQQLVETLFITSANFKKVRIIGEAFSSSGAIFSSLGGWTTICLQKMFV